MERNWEEMTLLDFSNAVASKAPVPGGGSVCAYVAALGVALGRMVGELTTGKKKYADTQEELEEIMERLKDNHQKMIIAIDEDAKGFLPLAEAFALPNETPSEKQHRQMVMESCLIDAAKVPLTLMRSIQPILFDLVRLTEIGSTLAISDAGSGIALCRAAVDAAILNVYINTSMMNDRKRAGSLNQEARNIQSEVIAVGDDALRDLTRKIKNRS